MASIKLSKWDIAEALGLECVSPESGTVKNGDCWEDSYWHEFTFNGRKILVKESGYVTGQAQAKEEAAQQVLDVLGKMIAERMK